MPPLVELVRAHVGRWKDASVEAAVFGSSDPVKVADHFERFCVEQLGTAAKSALFYGSSAGCVAGLRLADGHEIVIKTYQANWGQALLAGVLFVQDHLRDIGFACPWPLEGPVRAGPALATVEEYVPDPGMRTYETDAEMVISAQALSMLVDRCRGLDVPSLANHPLRTASPALYPDPHNPIFDFSANAAEAAWIDGLAKAAKDVRAIDHSEPVVGHTDWSARNVRIGESGLGVAYDWDSLALAAESTIVGQAAATWRSTGEATDPIAPGIDEVLEYFGAYETAAGRRFDPERLRAGVAAALWVLAYSARCEHALEAVTGKRLERARSRLAIDGHSFLNA